MNPTGGERRMAADRRDGERRLSKIPYHGDDRRSGDERRSSERQHQYENAVSFARAQLIKHGIDSAEFATAAETSEAARRELNEPD